MIKTKADRILIAAVSIFLALLMILLLPVQKIAAAEEKQTLYVSEVRLGYGKTAEEAAKSLEGYTIVKNGSKYADLNEGSGNKTVVLMGYKTTTNREEAITDIAAMNMKGGYSFSDYEELMNQYRDSQIMPFIRRFMETVKEYRANYNSTDKNNKAKAQYVREMLNLYTDDDTGMGLGDVFLKTTAEELGLDKYNKLSDSEKKKYGCLSTILMQGKTTTIFLIEQMLTLASDTSDTTWLQRFSKMSADDLLKEYTDQGIGETDAKKALAREYEGGAKIIADRWNSFRSDLMDFDDTINTEDGGIIPDENDIDILSEEDPEEKESEEEEPEEEEMTPEEADKILEGEDPDQLLAEMEFYSMYLEGMLADKTIDSAGNVKTAFLYNYLKALEYSGKTMYDYFTQSYDEIKKDNYFALYPLVASLTKGQIVGMEFLTLEQLVAVGATDNTTYSSILERVKPTVDNTEAVSVFAGVNRELYSDKVALTDYALRCNAAMASDDENVLDDVVNRAKCHGVLVLICLLPTVYTVIWAMNEFKDARPTIELALNTEGKESLEFLKQYAKKSKEVASKLNGIRNSEEIMRYIDNVESFAEGTAEKSQALSYAKKLKNYEKHYNEYFVAKTEIIQYEGGKKVLLTTKDGEQRYCYFNDRAAVEGDNIDDIITNVETKTATRKIPGLGSKWKAVLKSGVAAILCFALLGFTIYDIYTSAVDLYNYYNKDMTLVPKYIVDRCDISYADKNGYRVIYKNEVAYYQAIGSNRAKDHKFYETMQDYGDVNAGEGKQWLVLYTNKNTAARTPILADSLKVVTGTSDKPEGYTAGIHMFGEANPVNMTDVKFTYDNKLKGIFVYYKHAPALSTSSGASANNSAGEAPATSSAFSTGNAITLAVCGLLVGIAVGVFIMAVIKRKNEAGTE